MSQGPLMPKATAVWLVENTSLSFEQIADFCKLHPLEVKGIADGEVAAGIKGLDPITTNQLTREEIERAQADPDHRLRMAETKVKLPEIKRTKKGPRYTPVSRRHDRPNAILWLAAQPSRAEGRADHAPRRHHQDDDPADPRPHPLELRQPAADGPGDARPALADRPRLRGPARRQGPAAGRARRDAGQTLMPAEVDDRSRRPDALRRPRRRRARRKEDDIDVDSVFAKLKQLKRPDDEDDE